jgi:hypothetical protein
MALEFRTVPEELLGVADAASEWLKGRGFKVTPEHQQTGYPVTPTLYGKRSRMTGIVEVDAEVVLETMREWAAYGRSRIADTRVWCAVGADAKRSGKQDMELKKLGVGLLLISEGQAEEMIPPKDLAVNVELPSTDGLSPVLQKALGPVYDHFDRAEWREGFEEACLALEDAARSHLWKGVKAGRIVVVSTKGRQETLTKEKIDAFSMGDLTVRFGRIVQQTRADRVIGDTLKEVNPHRIGVAHHKNKAAAERKLRQNVGSKMWLIIGALREITESSA